MYESKFGPVHRAEVHTRRWESRLRICPVTVQSKSEGCLYSPTPRIPVPPTGKSLRSLAAPSASSRISAEILANAPLFPLGPRLSPTPGINLLRDAKSHMPVQESVGPLRQKWPRVWHGHPGNPPNCVGLLLALNGARRQGRRLPFIPSHILPQVPQWLFGPFRAGFEVEMWNAHVFRKLD